jgi:hypothetical protein
MNYKKVKFNIGLKDCELVTRNGQKVQFCGFNPNAIESNKVVGWVGRINMHWHDDGRFMAHEEGGFDLFALVEQDHGFINIHEDNLGKWADERIYDYCAIAVENGELSATYLKTIQIEL